MPAPKTFSHRLLKQTPLQTPGGTVRIADSTNFPIAATIAASVPGTEPYSTLATVVIRATQQAVAALNASSGRPIDLSVITPVMAI